ncbi:MAG: APC family permease [Parashewanella sp.]
MKRVLNLPSLVLFGLAFMSPLAAFVTYGVVLNVTHGHISTAYLLTLVAILFTALSYGKMSCAIPNSGSAYIYSSSAFGKNTGFLVGWALLLDYLLAPMLCYLVTAIYLQEYFPSIDKSVWIFLSALTIFVLNVFGIKLVTKINLFLVACQLLFVLVFLIMATIILMHTNQHVDFVQPFYDAQMSLPFIVSGSAILCLSFLGFESISTLADEAEHPQKTIPKAIILCVLASGSLYLLTAYMGQLVIPHWPSNTDADTMGLKLIRFVGGEYLKSSFLIMAIVGCLATALAALTSVSRVLYAMGKKGALPKVFGHVHKKFQTPVFAILIVSLLSLSASFMSLELASSMISFGALVAFTFVNLSVVKYYFIDAKQRHLMTNLFLPLIGFGLTIWLWTSLSMTAIEVGGSWLMIGVVYLLVSKLIAKTVNMEI